MKVEVGLIRKISMYTLYDYVLSSYCATVIASSELVSTLS
jgi:hypothetical protein